VTKLYILIHVMKQPLCAHIFSRNYARLLICIYLQSCHIKKDKNY